MRAVYLPAFSAIGTFAAVITSAQRKKLRALAHHLEPVVMIGKQGLTPAVTSAADRALHDHELIKVRFLEFKDEKKSLTARLAESTRSEIAGILGHVAILYREHADPEKRKIDLGSQLT
jgi:RNA-binding protein